MQLDARLIECCLRLRNTPEFEPFMSWLAERRQVELTALAATADEVNLRRGQGKVHMLDEIMKLIDGAWLV